MPRQSQKRIPRKTFKRKCHTCGKMATNPYVYHIVPSISVYGKIPIYQKSGEKTDRVDLTGKMKITVMNYCDGECRRRRKKEIWE